MTKIKEGMEYELEDGTKVPLFEADYNIAFDVRRSDAKGAIIGDPKECIEAKAMCRMKGVVEAYIGSSKDAYVVFDATRSRPFVHALHFTIPADAAKVRDAFDTNKKLKTQTLTLRAATEGRTLEHRRKLGKKRAKEIKDGAIVKKRSNQIREQRITRLGVPRRPTATITDGVVSLYDHDEVPSS